MKNAKKILEIRKCCPCTLALPKQHTESACSQIYNQIRAIVKVLWCVQANRPILAGISSLTPEPQCPPTHRKTSSIPATIAFVDMCSRPWPSGPSGVSLQV